MSDTQYQHAYGAQPPASYPPPTYPMQPGMMHPYAMDGSGTYGAPHAMGGGYGGYSPVMDGTPNSVHGTRTLPMWNAHSQYDASSPYRGYAGGPAHGHTYMHAGVGGGAPYGVYPASNPAYGGIPRNRYPGQPPHQHHQQLQQHQHQHQQGHNQRGGHGRGRGRGRVGSYGTNHNPIAPDGAIVCCYFLRGLCHHGTRCRFPHEDSGQPCRYGAHCRYGHEQRGCAGASGAMSNTGNNGTGSTDENQAITEQTADVPATPVPSEACAL